GAASPRERLVERPAPIKLAVRSRNRARFQRPSLRAGQRASRRWWPNGSPAAGNARDWPHVLLARESARWRQRKCVLEPERFQRLYAGLLRQAGAALANQQR